MNITFCFMEALLKINTSIFGENRRIEPADATDRQGPALCPGTSPAEIGAALADFVRTLISSTDC
jgi:hypothetical protein